MKKSLKDVIDIDREFTIIENEHYNNKPPKKNMCCLCRKRELTQYNNNNPEPFNNGLNEGGRCCNLCNNVLVVPTRILQLNKDNPNYHKNYLNVLKNWVRLCLE